MKKTVRKTLVVAMITCFILFLITPTAMAAKPHCIAHAGGSLEGCNMTNSAEALENAAKVGYDLIELDFAFTSDKKLVLLHDWPHGANYYLGLNTTEPVTYEDFMKCKIFGEYTPLTSEKLTEILKKYPNIKIITDTKEDNIAVLTQLAKEYPDIQNRFIPQIYSMEEYQTVKNLGYEDMILTLYKFSYPWDINAIANFAIQNNLYAITMDYSVRDYGYAQFLKDRGIIVYMHTVNSLDTAVDCIAKGAHGIFTDTLLPEEVTYPSWQYYMGASQNTVSQLAFESQYNNLSLYMNSTNKTATVNYYINNKKIASSKVNATLKIPVSSLPDGAQTLYARIYDEKSQYKTTKRYYLYKEKNNILLFGPQCKYLWDEYNGAKDINTILNSYDAKTKELAKGSFFVKEGSPLYYNNGISGLYRSGTAALPAVKIANTIHVPLRDTFSLMGASVAMNNTNKTMEITINGFTKSAAIINAENKPAKVYSTLKSNVWLYRNRAMANGALLNEATGRICLEQGEYMIILPKGTSPTASQKANLYEIAKTLYAPMNNL